MISTRRPAGLAGALVVGFAALGAAADPVGVLTEKIGRAHV